MPRNSLATIVASLHARSGKTLLARVLAGHFILSGSKPVVFDTDAVERKLCACFPFDAIVVDLNRVTDQMALFDTMAKPFPEARVVDLTHQSFRKFFSLMRDTDFVAEARANHVEPVIFYIPDRNPDSFEEARQLRDRFTDCAFVIVENGFLGSPAESVRRSSGYRALEAHPLRMAMPELGRAFAAVLEDPGMSFSDLMRQPLSRGDDPRERGDLSFDARAAVRTWLMRLFREIHYIMAALERRADALVGR